MPTFRLRRPLGAATTGLVALMLCAAAAVAEPAPPYPVLLRQAQESAPRLAEARAEIARAEGLARQARALPNPTLGVEVENFSGSGPFRRSVLAETTASLAQTVELGGKRSARMAAGGAEVEAARARARRIGAEFAFDLAAAYAEAEASDRRLQLATENLSLAQEDARVASALVEAGREADLRRVQAQAAVQSARAGVDEAQAARATAFANLTALSGAAAPLTSAPASLLDAAAIAAVPAATGAVPAYVAAQAEREAASRRLRLERTRGVPDVAVSLGLRKFQEDDSTALVAGVSVPLPIFDRNRGNVAAAAAELSAADARLRAAQLEAEAGARSASARASAAESRLKAAKDSETTAAEAYRLTRIGYEGGKLALVELLNARRALTDARAQTINAAVERMSAQAALARLSGASLFGDQK